MGQAQMEIFNCNAYPVTIKRDSFIGMVEQLHPEDPITQLNVEEMFATSENKDLVLPMVKREEKRKFIREMANLNIPEEFRQKYTDFLLKHQQLIT